MLMRVHSRASDEDSVLVEDGESRIFGEMLKWAWARL